MVPPGFSTSIATTASPSRSEMARTPYADRPIGRTSVSGKRIAIPSRVPVKISPLPSEICTAITESPSSTPMAMMPPARGLLNAANSVFLTTPWRVPITTYLSGSNSFTASSAAIRSPSSIDTRLAIALPRPSGPTSGTSCTFSQYARPRSEKIMM